MTYLEIDHFHELKKQAGHYDIPKREQTRTFTFERTARMYTVHVHVRASRATQSVFDALNTTTHPISFVQPLLIVRRSGPDILQTEKSRVKSR